MNDFKCDKCAKVLTTRVSEFGDTFVEPCTHCQFLRAKNFREMANAKRRESNTSLVSSGYIAGLMHAAQVCAAEIPTVYLQPSKIRIVRNKEAKEIK